MLKVNLGGCSSFVKDAEYREYLGKALAAFDTLERETGAGNDFLGWKHLPSGTPDSLISECEAIRDEWKGKGVDLVVVIGIGGSYLGAKCAIEALSHSFAKQLRDRKGMEVVFAGHTLSEEYISELTDLMQERNVAAVVISKSGTTTEPAVAFRLIKQYIELFKLDGIKLTFEPAVLDYIVDKAIEYKLGARGLRSICESIMMDSMFELPSEKSRKSFRVTLNYAKSKIETDKFLKLKAAN